MECRRDTPPRSSVLLVVVGLLLLAIPVAPRAPDPPVFGSVSHFPSICYLPPDSALCTPSSKGGTTSAEVSLSDDLLVRYYFDATTAQCYPFGVQGCGGNENRFETLAACQNYCRKTVKGS